MSEEKKYEVETFFNVYKIRDYNELKGFESVGSFSTKAEAEKWVEDEGDRKVWYKIEELKRKK